MLNYRCIISFLALTLVCASSCKPPAFSFKYAEQVNFNFFDKLPALRNRIDSIRVFTCKLEERLVERDAIPEYKLMNVFSGKSFVDFQVQRNFHYLYLFEVFANSPKDSTITIYLGTSYRTRGATDSICTGLGPSYYGNTDMYELHTIRQLKTKKHKGIYYLLNKKRSALHFYADTISSFDMFDPARDRFCINQVILEDTNKISGPKPLIFNVPAIFNDPDVLVFVYSQTIKK